MREMAIEGRYYKHLRVPCIPSKVFSDAVTTSIIPFGSCTFALWPRRREGLPGEVGDGGNAGGLELLGDGGRFPLGDVERLPLGDVELTRSVGRTRRWRVDSFWML